MSENTKREILAQALVALKAQHAGALASAQATRAGAVHEEAKPENDKDTRALEASYLARGQAMRAEELGETIERLRFLTLRDYGSDDAIGLGALVTLEDDAGQRRVLLVPVGGGLSVETPQGPVQLLSPAAPLGRALVEAMEGDEVEVRAGGRVRLCEIIRVH
ncbi:MAG: transcription elongation factor GreAB [Deltaproteobacteria bacterium]|nr:transcription elongation factor GreAB [Deltaproteobacteria bacterium]